MPMNNLTAFEAFSNLLQEVSVQHRDLQPWPDRPDLPQAVRHFWSCIGISKLNVRYAPKASSEADGRELERVFEDWFEYAITRDRWGLEPDDEPTPYRLLPAKPRRLAAKTRESASSPTQYRSYLLLASETEPEPTRAPDAPACDGLVRGRRQDVRAVRSALQQQPVARPARTV